jgi:hypothetical protein
MHGANLPYQVGTGGDNPNVMIAKKHGLKINYIIIVASDG